MPSRSKTTVAFLLPLALCLPTAAAVSASCTTGTVISSVKSYYIISCGTNDIEILKERAPGLIPGDRVLMPTGSRLRPYETLSPHLDRFVLIGHEKLPTPPLYDLGDVNKPKMDMRRVRLRGWAKSAILDPLDDNWMRLLLKSGSDTIDVAVPIPPNAPLGVSNFKYATIEVTGLLRRKIQGGRRFPTTSVEVSDINDISILSQPANPYDQPSIDTLADLSAVEILDANACTASGVVVAVWGRRSFLLQSKSLTDPLVRVNLNDSAAPPRFGDSVKAFGIVQTDLHHIWLTEAEYKTMARGNCSPPPFNADRCTFSGTNDDVYKHGKKTRIAGVVRDIAPHGPKEGTLTITTPDGLSATADISALDKWPDGLSIGCTIELTAVCIAETEPWHPGKTLANFRGMTLVPQTADDLRILDTPSWWTPGRLTAVILVLSTVIIGIFIWNRVLMALVTRRGHELFRAEHAKASAILRIDERTRLATELHDSLSQSISGIACQVVAAAHALGDNPAAARERLTAAENMLASCRAELGNCLFDLRSDMLEENDFTTAVRKSLSLVADAAERISVRTNISRARLHDATAHAILCIIRELASNALRHGKAGRVRVAGCVDGDRLMFSVTDDGTGFDCARCPGPSEGHFGLAGIRDRLRKLKGSMAIKPASPHGTRVEFSLPMPIDTTKTMH